MVAFPVLFCLTAIENPLLRGVIGEGIVNELTIIAKSARISPEDITVNTMNIALPENMKRFVHEQVADGGYSSASEYIRGLIRNDQKEKARAALEAEIVKGLGSGESTPMTDQDWRDIRDEIHNRHSKRKHPN